MRCLEALMNFLEWLWGFTGDGWILFGVWWKYHPHQVLGGLLILIGCWMLFKGYRQKKRSTGIWGGVEDLLGIILFFEKERDSFLFIWHNLPYLGLLVIGIVIGVLFSSRERYDLSRFRFNLGHHTPRQNTTPLPGPVQPNQNQTQTPPSPNRQQQ